MKQPTDTSAMAYCPIYFAVLIARKRIIRRGIHQFRSWVKSLLELSWENYVSRVTFINVTRETLLEFIFGSAQKVMLVT